MKKEIQTTTKELIESIYPTDNMVYILTDITAKVELKKVGNEKFYFLDLGQGQQVRRFDDLDDLQDLLARIIGYCQCTTSHLNMNCNSNDCNYYK